MRILAGEARGRPLRAPTGLATRPTSALVRGAIFDRLGPRLAGWTVLDLFAGTGALGLEALSRGAARTVFVESARPALRVLGENLAGLGFSAQGQVLPLPVVRALPRLVGQRFELALADAPYGEGALEPVLAQLIALDLIDSDGVLVTVHGAREEAPRPPTGWEIQDTRRFGDSAVTFYRPADEGQS